jgi:hypothetical protein
MLHQVLAQLTGFSTNSVNNNLIKLGDDGAKLVTTSIQKVVKYVVRFFDRMDNHILEGTYPDAIPKFTPRDANPKYQIASVIAFIEQGGLDLSRNQLVNEFLRGRNSSLLLGQMISPRLVFSIARKVSKQTNCSLWICRRSIAASFVSTIRDASSPIRLANLSMFEGGRKSLREIRK